MKKIYGILSLFLCCIFLAGCGRREDTQQEDVNWKEGQEKDRQQNSSLSEYTDILTDLRTIFRLEDSVGKEVGMQFYQGEAVQLQAVRGDGAMDLYLCKKGGSSERLLKDILIDYYYAKWFLDEEGNFYCWSRNGNFVKMDSSGKELYRTALEEIGISSINKICQLADGRILISYMEGEIGSYYTLSEIDSSGKISKVNTVKLDGVGDIAAGQEGLLYMDPRGVYEINMTNGIKTSILSFLGTSYTLPTLVIADFRMLPEGGVEFLRHDSSYDGVSEVLQAATITTDKAILALRCYDFSRNAWSSGSTEWWLKAQIELFNKQNSSCMVVLDESLDGMEREDFARQTSIEMAAGKGPDILFGDVLGDYVYGAIQKGALVDLTPYMESSGIREEDYFPAAFGCWKENGGIYGACMEISLVDYRISQEVLGEHRNPDAETLIDALLAWQEDAVFIQSCDSHWVLEYLLMGSENIRGMVDWSTGICDFSGELFAKILETAKRYGDDDRKNYPALVEYRTTSVMGFDTIADQEAEGMIAIGVPFDDGGHAAIMNSYSGFRNEMLAINANCAYVEGAWEFISFLLGEEVQMSFEGDNVWITNIRMPVNKQAFEVCTEKRVAKMIETKQEIYAKYHYDKASGDFYGEYERSYKDLTEEKLAEYMEFLEDARPLPIRTAPILDIIYEEAEYYFNGTKSIEEVSAIIQNRVQLYMDENS